MQPENRKNLMGNDDINAPETENDAKGVGRLRIARLRHQNVQLLGEKPRRDKVKADQRRSDEDNESCGSG